MKEITVKILDVLILSLVLAVLMTVFKIALYWYKMPDPTKRTLMYPPSISHNNDPDSVMIWKNERWFPGQTDEYKYDILWLNYCAHNKVSIANPTETDISYYINCYANSELEKKDLLKNK